jgi:hypothetical protein
MLGKHSAVESAAEHCVIVQEVLLVVQDAGAGGQA